MARAIWNGVVLAESDQVETVDGQVYFPMDSVDKAHLKESTHQSVCHWKGTARYFAVTAGGGENENAAWYYPDPMEAAAKIKNHVAFWRGVEVEA